MLCNCNVILWLFSAISKQKKNYAQFKKMGQSRYWTFFKIYCFLILLCVRNGKHGKLLKLVSSVCKKNDFFCKLLSKLNLRVFRLKRFTFKAFSNTTKCFLHTSKICVILNPQIMFFFANAFKRCKRNTCFIHS